MVDWTYKGKLVSQNPPKESTVGFIYMIRYTNGQYYIGKKHFFSYTKKKFGKKKLALIIDKRLKSYEIVVKESNWRTYIGSSKNTSKLTVESKEILQLVYDKVGMSYHEERYLFAHDVCRDMNAVNDCITKRYHSGKIK